MIFIRYIDETVDIVFEISLLQESWMVDKLTAVISKLYTMFAMNYHNVYKEN